MQILCIYSYIYACACIFNYACLSINMHIYIEISGMYTYVYIYIFIGSSYILTPGDVVCFQHCSEEAPGSAAQLSRCFCGPTGLAGRCSSFSGHSAFAASCGRASVTT